MKLDIKREFIFTDVNAPTKSSHASTIIAMDNGEVGVAWFGGTYESHDDVDIWFASRGRRGWSKPVRITADLQMPHWNPVLFKNDDGTLILYFKVGKKIPIWQTYFSISEDNGKTWSTPEELVPGDTSGGRGPVKNKAIRLLSGRIVAPSSTEQNKDWRCFVDLSDDNGKTWNKTDFIERPKRYNKTVGMIQPTLWESAPDTVHMLIRTNSRYIYRSDSTDGGKTWCPGYKTGLFNNNSGIDVVRTDDGKLYLISNPVKENWGERTPLTVVCSDDNGKTWGLGAVLESMPGEYSYPAIVAQGNELLISYTWNRKRICFARIKVTD